MVRIEQLRRMARGPRDGGLAGILAVLACAGCGAGDDRKSDPVTLAKPSTSSRPARHTTPPLLSRNDVYAADRAGRLNPVVKNYPERVYVPNSKSNTVDVINPRTFKIVRHFKTGALPQHVTPSYDLKTLWVDNDEGNSLTPIDPSTGKPGKPVPEIGRAHV